MEHRPTRSVRRWFIPAALLGLIVIGLFLAPHLIDINTYRDHLAAQLQERLGRSVRLGSLALSVFPSAKVEVTEAAIGDDPRFAQGAFIEAKSVELNIGVWSLLSGRPEVKSIRLSQPVVTLIKDQNGVWNWSTLKPLSPEAPTPEASPDTASPLTSISIAIRGGRFTLIDRRQSPPSERSLTGVDVSLEDFSSQSVADFSLGLTTPGQAAGRLEARGLIGPFDPRDFGRTPIEANVDIERMELRSLGALIGQSSWPDGRITLKAHVGGRLSDGLSVRGDLRAERLRLVQDGEPADMPVQVSFALRAKTQKETDSVAVEIDSGAVAVGDTRMNLTGRATHLSTDPTLDFHINTQNARLEDLIQIGRSLGSRTGITGTGTVNLQARIETSPGETASKRHLTGRGHIRRASLNLPQFTQPLEINAADLNVTGQKIRIENLRGRVAQSQFTGWLQVDDPEKRTVTFDLNFDQLIVAEFQKLMAANEASGKARPPALSRPSGLIPEVKAQQPRRSSDVGGYHADGQVSIGKVFYDTLAATSLESQVALNPDLIELNPIEFACYGGRYKGRLRMDLSQRDPSIAVAGRFDGIDMNQFLSAASSLKNVIYGRASGTLNLRGRGREYEPLVKSLSGLAELRLTDGRITRFDLIEHIARIGQLQGLPMGDAATVFRDLSTQLRFVNGRVITEDLLLALDQIEVVGTGGLQLGEPVETEYALLARLSEALTRRVIPGGNIFAVVGNFFMDGHSLVVPLKMTGPLTQPRFSLDGEVLKKAVTDRFRRRPGEAIKDILDILRGKDKSKPKEEKPEP